MFQGLSIGEISSVFERGLEASVDHLLHSSSVRRLNYDLSETSVEDVSYGCSASFEDEREDISGCPENEVSCVPANSFGGVEKFGSNVVNRQSLAEDEDVGWFFEEESKDPRMLDNYDSEKIVFTEHTNSNFAVDCTQLPSQDCKCLSDSDYLAEKLDNTRLCCSNPNSARLSQCLEIEDEFEDCFSDAVFGLRESESRLNISNSQQASQTLNHAEIKSSSDISDQNSTKIVLLNEDLNSEMFHKKADSNSKLTQEFAIFSSQCGNTGNSTSCIGDCHVLRKDKTEDLLDCENTMKYETVIDKTEDFGCENTAKFQKGHSDLVEKNIHATLKTIYEEAKHVCSKCVRPDCHCVNDAPLSVEPDCLILAQDTASKAPNFPLASAKTQPFHTSSCNFSNEYSRHSLLISSSEESEQPHTIQSKQNSYDELRHELISCQNALGLCVNSAAGDHPKAFDCKSLIERDNDNCKSDCVILATVGTNDCEKRVDSDCFEHSDFFRNEKEDPSMSKVTFCDATMGIGNIRTIDSCGLLNLQSCCDHETAFHDVIQGGEENTFCQEKSCTAVFEQRLTMLGSKLSHGANDMMKLVVKMAYQQLKDNGSTRYKQLLDIYSTRIYLLTYLDLLYVIRNYHFLNSCSGTKTLLFFPLSSKWFIGISVGLRTCK